MTTVGETHLHLATYFLFTYAVLRLLFSEESVQSVLFSFSLSLSQVFSGVSDAILTSPSSKFSSHAREIAQSLPRSCNCVCCSNRFLFLVLKFYNSNSGHLHTMCVYVCVSVYVCLGVTSAGSLT